MSEKDAQVVRSAYAKKLKELHAERVARYEALDAAGHGDILKPRDFGPRAKLAIRKPRKGEPSLSMFVTEGVLKYCKELLEGGR
jgi:hypothetical protein